MLQLTQSKQVMRKARCRRKPPHDIDQYQAHQKKAVLKLMLLSIDPQCKRCGLVLTGKAWEPNSAHLQSGLLFCPDCVSKWHSPLK